MSDRQRVKALFDQALEIAPGERTAWVASACTGDDELRAELERWLRAEASLGDFLESVPAPVAQTVAAATAHDDPQRFGAWRVLRALGAGGMGQVWLGERDDGQFEQRVAIKQVAWPTQDLIRRFGEERRILARLDHPNIARLIDAGMDVRGAPYLVMEYVDGEPITPWAHAHGLDLAARVRLFLPVLEAVQSAHSQLVVHRDIKPGNVLVDAHGTPKLLDFGIARLLDDPQTEAARTRTVLRALTAEYASPEQIRGDAVGIPSDIYSLGIVLYELLVGARPYRFASTSPAAIERTVCEAEPARPSAAWVAPMGPGAGNARDLDAVVLKALAKEPARRYASCAEFAAGLQRWLDGDAVLARVPSRRERTARYVARHRLPVALAALAALALLAGLVTISVLYRRALIAQAEAVRQKNAAVQETAAANAVKSFLDEDIIRAASPYLKTSAADLTVRQAIDRGAAKVGARFAGQPALEGEVRATLGDLYMQLNQREQAAAQYEKAGTLLGAALGESNAKTRYVRYASAALLARQGKTEAAHALLQRLDALAQPTDAHDAALSTVRDGAWALYWYRLHDWGKEAPFDRLEIADFHRWQPDNATGLAMRKTNLAIGYLGSGQLADAEKIAREVVSNLHAQGLDATVGYGTALSVLARVQYFRRDYGDAEASAMQAFALLRKIEGERSLRALDALYVVDRLQLDTGRYLQALENARQIHATYAAVLGADAAATGDFRWLLGHNEYLAGQREQGLADMHAGLQQIGAFDAAASGDNPLEKFFYVGDCLDYGGKQLPDARTLLAQLDAAGLHHRQPDPDWSARLDALRGQLAYRDGDHAKAAALLVPALRTMVAMRAPVFEIERAKGMLALAQAPR
ncbi:MAG: serine/threonine protein kinase [Proteobacteria bacterium]|nr:serine/threonine protein kinase [Pseudomonadota bacterium]